MLCTGLVENRPKPDFKPVRVRVELGVTFADLVDAVVGDDEIWSESSEMMLEKQVQALMGYVGELAEIDRFEIGVLLDEERGDGFIVAGTGAPHRRAAEKGRDRMRRHFAARKGASDPVLVDFDGAAAKRQIAPA